MKSKHIDWCQGLKCDYQIWLWPWHWPWILKVKYRICYISAKNGPIPHETKTKHINWTLGLKCDHQIWHWPWPWPWIFNVKYGICYISTKCGPIATNPRPPMRPMGLTLTVTMTFDFQGQMCLDHLGRYKDLPDSDRGDFRCRRAVDSSSYLMKLCVSFAFARVLDTVCMLMCICAFKIWLCHCVCCIYVYPRILLLSL